MTERSDFSQFFDDLEHRDYLAVFRMGVLEFVQNARPMLGNASVFCFAVDCNISFGVVHFALGTTRDIERAGSHVRQRAVDRIEQGRPVAIGDWAIHSAINPDLPVFSEAWAAIEKEIERICYEELYQAQDTPDLSDAFAREILSRLANELRRMEAQGPITGFTRTTDFELYLGDHDETISAGLNRIHAR